MMLHSQYLYLPLENQPIHVETADPFDTLLI
jgi:hypothetical protein